MGVCGAFPKLGEPLKGFIWGYMGVYKDYMGFRSQDQVTFLGVHNKDCNSLSMLRSPCLGKFSCGGM